MSRNLLKNPVKSRNIMATIRSVRGITVNRIISCILLMHALLIRVGAISKPHVSTPKSLTFVLKSTMNTKKW